MSKELFNLAIKKINENKEHYSSNIIYLTNKLHIPYVSAIGVVNKMPNLFYIKVGYNNTVYYFPINQFIGFCCGESDEDTENKQTED